MTRAQQIRQFEQVNRRFENIYMPKVERALHAKTKAVIARLRDGGHADAVAYLTRDIANDKLADVIRDLYTKVGRRWAQLNYSRLLPEVRVI